MGKNLKDKELGKGLYQRKDGRYEARAMIHGRKINLYGWDLKELKKRFAEEKSKLENSFAVDRREITLYEWFEEWFSLYKEPYIKSTSSHALRIKFRNTFGKLIGSNKLKNIINVDIQYAINHLRDEGRGASSIKEVLSLITQCMEVAKQNGIISSNPCFDMKVDWKPNLEPRQALSVDVQRRFLEIADKTWYKEFFRTLFLTGMRPGEIAGLQWNDIDWANGYLNIERSLDTVYEEGKRIHKYGPVKTMNSYRKIPFMSDLEMILKEQQRKQNELKKEMGARYRCKEEFSNIVFTTSLGSVMGKDMAGKQCRIINEEMNLIEKIAAEKEGREPVLMKTITPYMIRHTFATRCFESGMDTKVVQQLMGHAHYSTTMDIYVHVMGDKLKAEVEKFSL